MYIGLHHYSDGEITAPSVRLGPGHRRVTCLVFRTLAARHPAPELRSWTASRSGGDHDAHRKEAARAGATDPAIDTRAVRAMVVPQ